MTTGRIGTPVLYGSAQNKTSGTSLAMTSNQIVPVGTHILVALAHDNHASTTATTASISTMTGNPAWVARQGAIQQGQTTTAGSGVVLRWWSIVVTTQLANGGSIGTITFGNAIVAKAMVAVGAPNWGAIVTGTTAGASGSAAGTPATSTGGQAPASGDVVVGVTGCENISITGDSDTLNGEWTPILGINTTGSTAATNIAVGVQMKQVEAGGHQTWNPVGANDQVSSLIAFQGLHNIPLNQWGVPL